MVEMKQLTSGEWKATNNMIYSDHERSLLLKSMKNVKSKMVQDAFFTHQLHSILPQVARMKITAIPNK